MSTFYASIPNSMRKTVPTARGSKDTGITATAQSYEGSVSVGMYLNDEGKHMICLCKSAGSCADPSYVLYDGLLEDFMKSDKLVLAIERS